MEGKEGKEPSIDSSAGYGRPGLAQPYRVLGSLIGYVRRPLYIRISSYTSNGNPGYRRDLGSWFGRKGTLVLKPMDKDRDQDLHDRFVVQSFPREHDICHETNH